MSARTLSGRAAIAGIGATMPRRGASVARTRPERSMASAMKP